MATVNKTSGYFAVSAEFQNDPAKLVALIKAKYANNDLTEAIVRGDDGKYYLAYAEKFPHKKGERVDSNGLRGEVVDVFKDKTNFGESLLEGLSAGTLAGVAISAASATYGLSLALLSPAGMIYYSDDSHPDAAGIESLRPAPIKTSPAQGLAPKTPTGVSLGKPF